MKKVFILLFFLVSCKSKTLINIDKQDKDIIEVKRVIEEQKQIIVNIKEEIKKSCQDNIVLNKKINLLEISNNELSSKTEQLKINNDKIRNEYVQEMHKFKRYKKSYYILVLIVFLMIFLQIKHKSIYNN